MRTAIAISVGQKAPTVVETARYIAEKSGAPPEVVAKISSNSRERASLQKDLLITQNKELPQVKVAKSKEEAYKAILDQQERNLKALLATKNLTADDDLKLIRGDCIEEMKKLRHGQFDVIFTDPPYGIGADTMKSDSKHFYKDDPESALRVCREIISQGFNLCKPKATLFMWCDVEHFVTLRDFAGMQGWVTWRTPLVWWKGMQGHAPWGRAGFVRSYETLLFAVKGQRELYLSGGPDVCNIAGKTRGKSHAAEKPLEVINFFLSRAALQGDAVLDPCCGSGPIFEVGAGLKLKVTGIELSPDYYNTALARIGDIRQGGSSLGSVDDDDEADIDEEPDVLDLINGRA